MRGKYELISAKSALTIKSNGLNLFLAVGILVRPLRWYLLNKTAFASCTVVGRLALLEPCVSLSGNARDGFVHPGKSAAY
jgi:hypothetical protein